MMKTKENRLLLLSIAFYVLSLVLSPYEVDGEGGELLGGLICLLVGWMGMLGGGVLYFSWLANPLILAAWISSKRPKLSIVFSILAILCCLLFLTKDEILVNEGGGTGEITKIQIGYWFWIATPIVMIIKQILILQQKKPIS